MKLGKTKNFAKDMRENIIFTAYKAGLKVLYWWSTQ